MLGQDGYPNVCTPRGANEMCPDKSQCEIASVASVDSGSVATRTLDNLLHRASITTDPQLYVPG